MTAFAERFPAKAAPTPASVPWREVVSLLPRKDEAFVITTQVNYVAAAQKLFAEGEKVDGALTTVSRCVSWGAIDAMR